MQHNEDLCVIGSSGSWLQGVDINKHMQSSNIRELLYIAQNPQAWLLLQGFFPSKNLQNKQTHWDWSYSLSVMGRTFLISFWVGLCLRLDCQPGDHGGRVTSVTHFMWLWHIWQACHPHNDRGRARAGGEVRHSHNAVCCCPEVCDVWSHMLLCCCYHITP